ncbi:fertilization-influencing membrane protein isoform X1 [Sminthopsis crassicaudata]|uniref:fertilization-influencing membrane protein isoform X1 n=1 Tax=Sminthopsis crassicaudata TaxID=9301 RepID=UPI003D69A8CD
MKLWLWLWLTGVWAVGAAIYPQGSMDMTPQDSLFLEDNPNFFDYPDSAKDKILAVSNFIGEKPVYFTSDSGFKSRFLHQILFGSFILLLIIILYQFFTHMSCQKGS